MVGAAHTHVCWRSVGRFAALFSTERQGVQQGSVLGPLLFILYSLLLSVLLSLIRLSVIIYLLMTLNWTSLWLASSRYRLRPQLPLSLSRLLSSCSYVHACYRSLYCYFSPSSPSFDQLFSATYVDLLIWLLIIWCTQLFIIWQSSGHCIAQRSFTWQQSQRSSWSSSRSIDWCLVPRHRSTTPTVCWWVVIAVYKPRGCGCRRCSRSSSIVVRCCEQPYFVWVAVYLDYIREIHLHRLSYISFWLGVPHICVLRWLIGHSWLHCRIQWTDLHCRGSPCATRSSGWSRFTKVMGLFDSYGFLNYVTESAHIAGTSLTS